MSRLVLLTKDGCPYCSLLKFELTKRGHAFETVDLSDDKLRQCYYDAADVTTMPQLYIVPDDVEFSFTSPTGHRLGGWSEVSKDWNLVVTP